MRRVQAYTQRQHGRSGGTSGSLVIQTVAAGVVTGEIGTYGYRSAPFSMGVLPVATNYSSTQWQGCVEVQTSQAIEARWLWAGEAKGRHQRRQLHQQHSPARSAFTDGGTLYIC